ncbi:MAG: hypothetical protein QOJ75_1549, partial [Chloroflexota bacterium]|nr:hypothetical protein [Chloroflexota bacterium]
MVRRVNLAVLLVVLSVAGCESSVPTPSPAASSAASSAAAPSATAVPTDHASSSLVDPFLGSTVVTVSDNLRVRSAPGISDESRKYEPLLPLGTQLRVMGGPVSASDYVWYDVAPVGFPLLDAYNRVDHGWVAMADHDGQPWLALAAPTIAGLELATSDVARAPANAADASAAASSVSAFGLDLYREMLAEPNLHLRERNVVFSPMSIALALGMARAGAREATSSQMDTVLHTSGWDTLRSGLNSLDQALASRDGTYLDDERKPHQLALRVANASFAQQGWSIEPAYLDALASAFGAGLNLVDYAGHPEAALQTINAWVSQKTAKRIPELLQDVSSSARLYLVNAIYLKANWEVPFPTSLTAPRPFNRPDGSTVTVPTMGLGGGQEVPYVRGGGWRATQLRYLGRDRTTPLAMTLIEPDDLASFESTLNPKQLGQIVSALTRERT